jgi:hypothetical protein
LYRYLLLYKNNNFNNNITIMSIFLKKFDNHTEYEEARQNLILPNVSYCVNENEVHYNPWVEETRVVATFNVTSTSRPTPIGYNKYTSGFSEIEIDGVQTAVTSAYTFSTRGEHTVKYTLTDPTRIGNFAFYDCSGLTSIDIPSGVISIGDSAIRNCSNLTSINIPNSVTSIGNFAFENCSNLTSCTIGSGVTSIGTYAFSYCTSLTSIVSNAMTAPTITNSTFLNIKTGGTLTVPSGSTGYDVWMGTGNYYLGMYNWTKVEQ